MAERIIQKDSLSSYKDDLIAYSININRVRSIPNRKDSLKPVQRRNIYGLFTLSATNRSKKIKSARVVGDVMGKFHPHGDCISGTTSLFYLDGTIAKIEDLYASELGSVKILAVNPETQKVEPAIAHSFRIGQYTDEIYHIVLSNGVELQCTSNHPIMDVDGQYIQAKDITIGTIVYTGIINNDNNSMCITDSADKLSIIDIQIELVNRVPMYDFTVDKYENMLIPMIPNNENITHISQVNEMHMICIHNSSIYGSLEPLLAPWKCKVPILAGVGNWGNVMGNSPAAMRYTEVYLSQFGYECVIGELADTDNVVDWSKNFDGTSEEPDYLPVKVPLLLINGSSGIGLGISCDIPKHNMIEVINATRELIAAEIEAWEESQRTGKDVIPRDVNIVLVPDHCLPAKIIDTDWEAISRSGSGTYRIRGIVDIVTDSKGNQEIQIKSIPDCTTTEAITEALDKLIVSKHLPMVKDFIDLSDNGNVLIKIQLKKGSDANYVREILYKRTNCEMSCTVNFEVVDGLDLKRIGYKEYLQGFIADRALTKFRLYANRMQKVMTRWHKLDAYTKALESGEIDNIINMIRKRKTTDDSELIDYLIKKLNVTDMQAMFIINANIKQLSMGHLKKYKEEHKALWEDKLFCEKMILDKGLILREIDQELVDIATKYGQPRICKVIKASDDNNIPKGTFKIIITENNFVRKITETEKATSVKGDNPKFITIIDNTDSILLFDEKGRVYKLPVHKIPISERNNPGIDVRMIIKGLTANIISMFRESDIHKVAKLKEKHFVTIVTENNYIKKLDIQDFINVPPSGIIYSKLNDGDSVKSIEIISDKLDVIIYSKHKALRVSMQDIPCYKRISMGVLAMNTSDKIGGLSVVYPNAEYILVVTSSGKINKYNISGLDRSARYKAGSSVIKLGKDEIYAIYGVSESNILRLIMKESAEPVIIPIKDVPIMSSVSTGTKMVNIKNDKIIRSDILLTLDQM